MWVEVYRPSFVEPVPVPDGTTPDLGLPQFVTAGDAGGARVEGVLAVGAATVTNCPCVFNLYPLYI